jgi:Subtilase family
VTVRTPLATLGATLALVGVAHAAPAPPMVLPGDAGARAATAARAQPATWIVGARAGTADAIARRFGARSLLRAGTAYLVARRDARPFAAALRRHGLLAFAEPNWRARRAAFPQDPLFNLQAPLLKSIDPSLTPPPVTPTSPLLAIADAQIDATHPEFQGTALTLANPSAPVTEIHGTAVASVAGAAANGVGMVGVWPGMRLLGEPNNLTCAGDASAVDAATRAGAAVINMSYGGPFCYAEYLATSYAFGAGRILVAAGGNDLTTGNRASYPASDPHVLTVAATDQNDGSAFFSTENAGIDLSAPGVGILVAVPPALDNDGNPDGYQLDAGTSFSSPIVAAAAAWLEAARPGLANDQYMDLLRLDSDDLGDPGWDAQFGFGRLNLAKALAGRPGPHDVGEPNDDIPWVNGTLYRLADKPIFGRFSRVTRQFGLIDQWEDPADVYRVTFPRHARLRLQLKPLLGDPDLFVYSRRGRTIYSRRGLVARSTHRGNRTDALTIGNSGGTSVGYVAIRIAPTVRTLDAAYRLTVRRLRG